MIGARARFTGVSAETSIHYRTCPLCEATCGLEVSHRDGEIVRIRGDRDDVFSHGFICPKGSTLGKLDQDPDRVRQPLVKHDGSHVPVSWDEAFALIESKLAPLIAEHGPNAVGVYLGNPNVHSMSGTLYVRALLKMLRTRNLFSAATVDQMPKHVSSGHMFGHPDLIPVPDIDRTDYLLLMGANPYESNGSLATAPDWPGRMEAISERGGKVVVVDPRRTKTAAAADEHIAIRPGTDPLFLFAVANVIFEAGLVDLGDLTGIVAGLDEVAAAVVDFTPEAVAEATGIPASVDPPDRHRAGRGLVGRGLRPGGDAHRRVRDHGVVDDRCHQRDHREPRPSRWGDVPPGRTRATPVTTSVQHGTMGDPGAGSPRDPGRAARLGSGRGDPRARVTTGSGRW